MEIKIIPLIKEKYTNYWQVGAQDGGEHNHLI